LGQDGLILGSCAILIALGVRARIERRWTRSALLLLAVFGVIVAFSKIVYLPLVGLALCPVPRPARPLPWLAWPTGIGLIGAALSALWLHSNAGSVVRMAPDVAEPSAQLSFVLGHPLAFMATLGNTVAHRPLPVFLSTFTFGWMNVGPVLSATLLVLASLGFALRQGGETPAELSRGWWCWAALLIFTVTFAIVSALYLADTPLGAPIVNGLQGRYFLPLVPLLCLFSLRGRASPTSDPAKLAIVLMLGANLAALSAIAAAYYRL
jgi:uncharacterized membrane protein